MRIMLLVDRFGAAAQAEPLNDLSELDRAELTALLLRVRGFEELPGRWQAALLCAEAGAPAAGGGCGCGCHA